MAFSELQQVMKTEELKERVFSIKHQNKEGWMESDGFFVLTSIVLYCGLFKNIYFIYLLLLLK